MIGLLKNDFYSVIGNAKIFLVFICIWGCVAVVVGTEMTIELYGVLSIVLFACNVVAIARNEESGKWNKYKLSLPVTRKQIVKSRFISFTAMVAVGIMVSCIIIGVTMLIHGNKYFYYGVRDVTALISVGIMVSFLMGAIFIPMVCLFGADKSEITFIISLVCGVGLTVTFLYIMNFINEFNPVDDKTFYIQLGILAIATTIIYVCSYFVTTAIYRKKEY